MKANPCRYCSSAYEFNGRHKPSFGCKECNVCPHIRKHEVYLESKRVFKRGDRIANFDELMRQNYVFVGHTPNAKHIEVIKSWQLRIILGCLEKGSFYKAIRKESEGK